MKIFSFFIDCLLMCFPAVAMADWEIQHSFVKQRTRETWPHPGAWAVGA